MKVPSKLHLFLKAAWIPRQWKWTSSYKIGVFQMSTCPPPKSCDTFVVLPDRTKGGHVVFGKNSDRPREEVQEVIYRQPMEHEEGSKLQVSTERFVSEET